MIKRKWPKIDQGGPWTPLRRQTVQGGCGLARHWFRGRLQASALPLVGPWAVLPSVRLPEGPGSLARHWIRSGSRLPFGPHFLHPSQGGRVSPDSAANRGRAGLTSPSLAQRRRERQSYQGASGGPDSAANRAAGRADTPPLDGCRPARGPGGLPGQSLATFF